MMITTTDQKTPST